MGRLIDANRLIAEMHNVILEDGEDRRTFYEVIERQPTIMQLPPAEKTGKWINYKDEHRCSCCGEVITGDWFHEDDAYSYCPNCGAKMEE